MCAGRGAACLGVGVGVVGGVAGAGGAQIWSRQGLGEPGEAGRGKGSWLWGRRGWAGAPRLQGWSPAKGRAVERELRAPERGVPDGGAHPSLWPRMAPESPALVPHLCLPQCWPFLPGSRTQAGCPASAELPPSSLPAGTPAPRRSPSCGDLPGVAAHRCGCLVGQQVLDGAWTLVWGPPGPEAPTRLLAPQLRGSAKGLFSRAGSLLLLHLGRPGVVSFVSKFVGAKHFTFFR